MTDIEKWKKIIISLPEQIFFDLIRNYLGDVKTPFNKHNLIDEFAAFLRKEKNLDKIIALIDEQDAFVLTVLDILGPIEIKTLYPFFSDKKNYYDFYLHLQNLEERMLICSDKDAGESPLLIISPLFKDVLKERVIDHSIVIPAVDVSESLKKETETWYFESLLFSVLSYLLGREQVLKLDGHFKKRIQEELMEIFPGTMGTDAELKIDIMRKVLKRLNLVRQEAGVFKPAIGRWKEFMKLSFSERQALCTGAFFSSNYSLYFSLVDKFMKIVCSTDKGFPKKSLLKIIDLLFVKNYLPQEEWRDDIIKILSGLEYLKKDGDYYYPNPAYLSILNNKKRGAITSDSKEPCHFILQPNFDIHVSKDIIFHEGVMLAFIANIKKYSDIIYFTLSKESFLRVLKAGYTCKDVIDFFNRLAGYPVPQNVQFSMESWEKEYKSLEFYKGIVLVADEKKSNVIDNSGHFSSDLCRKLGAGIYLINEKDMSALLEAFNKAGIDSASFPQTLITDSVEREKSSIHSFKEDLVSLKFIDGFELDFSKKTSPPSEQANADFSEIREKIEKSNFTAEQKEVVLDRLERKLILSPEQIRKGNARLEKTEARGLDYNGKVRIAEEVAGNSCYLAEVVENNLEGESVRRLIKAKKIEKEGNVFFLKGSLLLDDSEVSISISKISLIRKIRTSLVAS
ncbi:MAG: helicase-associated domain-containing protein [Spirochaetes bacterium]|nr:helicase-associated domain-containing protein [Spirochaetota bacterium]